MDSTRGLIGISQGPRRGHEGSQEGISKGSSMDLSRGDLIGSSEDLVAMS